MNFTSIILVVDKYFEDEEVIFDNLLNANCYHELLVFNNGGNVSQELIDASSQYIYGSPVEESFADCVNKLLPLCSGNKICVLYNYAYFEEDWLRNLIATHDRIVNSGVISLRFNRNSQTNYFLNVKDELEKQYFDNNRVDGMMFFDKTLLNLLGGLNNNLHSQYCFYEYCYRAGLVGKYNYYLVDNTAIQISAYTTTYVTSYKAYLDEIKNIKPFKILNKDNEHQTMLNALENIGIECNYSARLNKIAIINKEFDSKTIYDIQTLCVQHNYDYTIGGTGYFEDYLFKARTGIFLNKLL